MLPLKNVEDFLNLYVMILCDNNMTVMMTMDKSGCQVDPLSFIKDLLLIFPIFLFMFSATCSDY